MSYLPRTLIVCTAHREASRETHESMHACGERGAYTFTSGGVSDTALARNIAFEKALKAAKELSKEIIIFVDDDMAFLPDLAEKLAGEALARHAPVSATYVLSSGNVAATCIRQGEGNWSTHRWLTGLGMLAIPAELLATLGEDSKSFATSHDGECRAFTWSGRVQGPDNVGMWFSEDYQFCHRLGGVMLLPMRAGHMKMVPLEPDDATLVAVDRGCKHD